MPDVFFTVDPDGLDALKSQLEHIQGGMQDTGNAVDAYSPLDLGPDNAVWNALQAFQSDWSAGLATIGRNLTAMETLLDEAAADYRGTDQQIAQMTTQPGAQLLWAAPWRSSTSGSRCRIRTAWLACRITTTACAPHSRIPSPS